VRIKAIAMAWFRGAANQVTMELSGKSIVVYGTNGAGKSSFVDALEYAINGGRICHLAHEYSGKKQENAIPNTHRPKGTNASFCIQLTDGSEIKTEIKNDGTASSHGSVTNWDYRRTVLRQGEVVQFIQDTKGDKYSALLPLFGLQELEVAAENLRQLARNVESLSQLEQRKASLHQALAARKNAFGPADDIQIRATIDRLFEEYCKGKMGASEALDPIAEISAAIDTLFAGFTNSEKQYFYLREAASSDLKTPIKAIRAANSKLASAPDSQVSNKIAVLQQTERYLAGASKEGELECPACGQRIDATAFNQHVKTELDRLQDLRETYERCNAATGNLCDSIRSLKQYLNKQELEPWQHGLTESKLADSFRYLGNLDPDALRKECTETHLQQIETNLQPLVDAAASASTQSPPEAKTLADDKRTAAAANDALRTSSEAALVAKLEQLVRSISALEQATRAEIRSRSNQVIREISDDIKQMWSLLHPGEAIEHVHLYLPRGADKAIDIGLKFYGKELDSPRLTLSEGYRNSLGLCVFLAMAKREAPTDRPIVLDDVVISLDRNHRGMIAELIQEAFWSRQVIILTHDRDWYIELRQRLNPSTWNFRALLPYETPETGIKWSHKTSTFDDARSQLRERPDAASNDARKIMDTELSLIAESLQLRLRYQRFEKNDRRLAHDFLERMISAGKKCFQKKVDREYSTYEEALQALGTADTLLLSWANRGSHTFDVAQSEAVQLIDSCETALEFFKCQYCKKNLWFANAERAEWVQCQCGTIRWRYDKD